MNIWALSSTDLSFCGIIFLSEEWANKLWALFFEEEKPRANFLIIPSSAVSFVMRQVGVYLSESMAGFNPWTGNCQQVTVTISSKEVAFHTMSVNTSAHYTLASRTLRCA